MRFWKAHAYGNDFLYTRHADVGDRDLSILARMMCARHTGVGADGLILFDDDDVDVARMRLVNADGTPAEVSGNGVRALAALLARIHGRDHVDEIFAIDTDAGRKTLTLVARDEQDRPVFRAAMGQPESLQQVEVEVEGRRLPLVTLWMGNPQAVWLVAHLDEREMLDVGAALQRHPSFPHATNFELATVAAPSEVHILIYERGVGPTLSSGTGSCAAAVAAAAYGGAERAVDVVAPGGRQHVEWTADGVWLTGWAEVVLEGHWIP